MIWPFCCLSMSAIFNNFLISLNLDPKTLGAIDMVSATVPERPAKHRACDECRTRKLACSKDADGCERCRRENVTCHYSEQKPMGRPRKRQFVESTEGQGAANTNTLDLAQAPDIVGAFDGYLDTTFVDPYFTNGSSYPSLSTDQPSQPPPTDQPSQAMWHFGGGGNFVGPPINFDNADMGNSIMPLSAAEIPQLSAASNSSVSDNANPPPLVSGPCSCLASIYLALSSLHSISSDITVALRTVRAAAGTAAECIWCQRCGSIVLEDPNPPIEAFQNTMLLGTLLPIIASSYQKLLKQIDEETEAAEAAGLNKTFRFEDYGGFCGRQQTVRQAMICVEKEVFFKPIELPPQQWRSTVRALLRVDIYGHEQGECIHKGLKDLVKEMEARQRKRHEILDAHISAGRMEFGPFGQKICMGERGPNGEASYGCLQMLNMAKVAIDSLTIA